MTMVSEDRSLKLEKLTPKRMLVILRDFSSMERNTARAMKKIQESICEYRETEQLISEEEAIFAASVRSPALEEKVQTSGNIEHDELFRTLEQAKRLQKEAAEDLMTEEIRLLKTRKQLGRIRLSIHRLDTDDNEFVTVCLISGMTATDGMEKACLGKAAYYKKAARIATKLTDIYNEGLESSSSEQGSPLRDEGAPWKLCPQKEAATGED